MFIKYYDSIADDLYWLICSSEFALRTKLVVLVCLLTESNSNKVNKPFIIDVMILQIFVKFIIFWFYLLSLV